MHKCKNHSRRVCFWCFMASVNVLAFPFEHKAAEVAWTKTPLLRSVWGMIGMGH